VSVVPEIEAIRAAGIEVMGHIGMLPQSIKEEGGYKIKGKTEEGREQLLADARAIEAAGAFAIVLELVEPATAALITKCVGVPTIGIGSGENCDGQILVINDLVGSFPWFKPKFAVSRADVASAIRVAAESYLRDVQGGLRSPTEGGR
jgi:3-methyl-2-oxobutanoate hydroxymethyltransferase